MNPWLTVVIPALNEAARLPRLLGVLQPWRGQGVEVVLVDGGSADDTPVLAEPLVDQLLLAQRGRARQMNVGATAARAPLLWFVHADSDINDHHLRALQGLPEGPLWGRFDVRLAGHWLLPLVAGAMNLRSRLTGIATGDQAIFVSRSLFDGMGGFPEQPLMEDIALSARLRRLRRPDCLRLKLGVDARRWRQKGVLRTILQMWWLRFRYWRGADPTTLHREYYR